MAEECNNKPIGGRMGGLQPDSLKLTSQIAILKYIHTIAFRLENTQGDKSYGRQLYIQGVQGRVCTPVWNRDYFYFTGLINEIRTFLRENCVKTLVNDLFITALNIFNRNENRRRMGAELIVLCILSNESQTAWSLPQKYLDTDTITNMLVSMKSRFQKPKVVPFWSKQSEALLLSTLRHATNLTKLVLPLCNDLLLKSISVYCRKLLELEIGFSEDVSEEGLLALSGRSAFKRDQGLHRKWDNALYLQNDFGPAMQWYVKDCMLFTPPCTNKRPLPPKERIIKVDCENYSGRLKLTECDKLMETFPTNFGCTHLKRLKIFGNFVFPARATRSKFNKNLAGPVLEAGFYSILLHLKNLEELVLPAASLMVARLSVLLSPEQLQDIKLKLKELSFGWDERLEAQEMTTLAKLCPQVKCLRGVSNGIPNDFHISDRFRIDDAVCDFVKRFHNLTSLSGNIKLTCLNSYLRLRGDKLTYLNCSSLLLSTADLVTLRRYCINLQRLDARLTLDNTIDKAFVEYHCDHTPEFAGTIASSDINIDSPWSDWKHELSRWPWRKLKHLDLNGRFNLIIVQLLLGSADHLEILSVTNWPNEMVSGGMALDDSWVQGIIAANPLHNLKEFCLKMENDHVVEEGFLTKTSLNMLINHAVENCPKLEKIVGEWTKIPDRDLLGIQDDCWKRGLKVSISNAEPYRDFQNFEDNDRFYGMNAGYWRLRGIPVRGEELGPGAGYQQDEEPPQVQIRYPRTFGYMYRPL